MISFSVAICYNVWNGYYAENRRDEIVRVGVDFPFAGAGFDDTLAFGIFQFFHVQMRFALAVTKGFVFGDIFKKIFPDIQGLK